jgi:hypothetical protein
LVDHVELTTLQIVVDCGLRPLRLPFYMRLTGISRVFLYSSSSWRHITSKVVSFDDNVQHRIQILTGGTACVVVIGSLAEDPHGCVMTWPRESARLNSFVVSESKSMLDF